MYATCLFCNGSLGANESIEHFPVGRRLAYDSAAGRLWVVCIHCARWNLSPLETRWEAIEEAERLFRSTKLRVSSDNIGLARISEGTELVRIGKPLQTEFAAWRYGDQFRKRHRKMWIGMTGSIAFSGASMVLLGSQFGGAHWGFLGVSAVAMSSGLNLAGSAKSIFATWKQAKKITANVHDERGQLLRLSQRDAHGVSLIPTGHMFDWTVRVPRLGVVKAGPISRMLGVPERTHYSGADYAYLRGDVARRALAVVLTQVNYTGASKRGVNDALNVLNESGNVQYLLHRATTFKTKRSDGYMSEGGSQLIGLPPSLRLALEMSLHSDDENRAMQGELKELEQRWRDADAIAKIADQLFLPESVDVKLRELQRDDG